LLHRPTPFPYTTLSDLGLKPPLAHEGRHQQTADISPAIFGLAHRRFKPGHVARGIFGALDLGDDFAQTVGGASRITCAGHGAVADRKSTRLNSSHVKIS